MNEIIDLKVIYKFENIDYFILSGFLNFVLEYGNNQIAIEFINFKEDKYRVKTKVNSKQFANIILLINDTLIKYSYKELQKFIFSKIEINNIQLDYIIFGSGISAIETYRKLNSISKSCVIIDDIFFGKSFLNEGISTDISLTDEISTYKMYSNSFSKTTPSIIYNIDKQSIQNCSDSITINMGSFTISSSKLIISENSSPLKLHIENEKSLDNEIIFDVYNNIEKLVNKKVVIIGDYKLLNKLKIISKVAKKVTHLSLIDELHKPIKLFVENNQLSGILVKHKNGYSKPIKCNVIVYSNGYEDSEGFEHLNKKLCIVEKFNNGDYLDSFVQVNKFIETLR